MYERSKQRNSNGVDNCEFMLFGFRDQTDKHNKLYTVIIIHYYAGRYFNFPHSQP